MSKMDDWTKAQISNAEARIEAIKEDPSAANDPNLQQQIKNDEQLIQGYKDNWKD